MHRIQTSLVYSVAISAMFANAFAEDKVPAAGTVDAGVTVAQPASAAAPSEAVATAAPPIRIVDLTGDWCGTWQSCSNGHNGPMRASFCRQCDGNYRVTFVGRFCKVIPFRYTTTLNVTGYADGIVYLSGSQSLGPIFGTFSYNAWATDSQFVSGYSANKDQGQFTLSK